MRLFKSERDLLCSAHEAKVFRQHFLAVFKALDFTVICFKDGSDHDFLLRVAPRYSHLTGIRFASSLDQNYEFC